MTQESKTGSKETAIDNALPAGSRWSRRMADSALRRYSKATPRWHYEDGLLLKSFERMWRATGDPRYWAAVGTYGDHFVLPDGSIRMYRIDEYNLDQINTGKILFPLYRETGEERYRSAIELLAQQLRQQPRTRAGGFWHKLIYPDQIWLDGIYMASPFMAEYALSFGRTACFDDVAHQVAAAYKQTYDPRTGLLYHAWDESKRQRWSDPHSGTSHHFWGRAMGWYLMALVDILDFFPSSHPERNSLIDTLAQTAEAVARVQDPATGLWYQLLDLEDRPGNYLESSASCMFAYAMFKGARHGYLGDSYRNIARRALEGVVANNIAVDTDGDVHLTRICGAAGLGGEPYRDGSFEYYVSEPVATDDYKGVGPFILASLELEQDAASRSSDSRGNSREAGE